MKLATNIFAFVLHLLGILFAIDGVNTLFAGGGTAGAVGVTNGLLLIISGQLVWILTALKTTKKAV